MFIKKSEKGKQKKKIFYRLEGANEAAGIVSLCEMPLRMNIIIALWVRCVCNHIKKIFFSFLLTFELPLPHHSNNLENAQRGERNALLTASSGQIFLLSSNEKIFRIRVVHDFF